MDDKAHAYNIALGRLSLNNYFTKLEQYFRETLLSRGS